MASMAYSGLSAGGIVPVQAHGQSPLLSTSHSDAGADNKSGQGKVAELRLELNSGGKKDKNHSAKKIALKKIVANMTMSNNDMVALFPDVVGCMQIPSLEIKKMYAIPLKLESYYQTDQ